MPSLLFSLYLSLIFYRWKPAGRSAAEKNVSAAFLPSGLSDLIDIAEGF